jgi:hypothetical protein
MAAAGMFLPWWHYQTCDSLVDNCQPHAGIDLYGAMSAPIFLVPILAASVTGLFSLLLHSTLGLRQRRSLLLWAILLGVMTLVTGIFAMALVALSGMFLNAFSVVPEILDSGYFIALTGYILLVPGALLQVVAESRWRDVTRPAAAPGAPGPKSINRGLLLEFFIPGTGAAYAGRSSIGLGWWLGTVVGGLILALAVFIPINTLDALADNANNNALNLFPATAIILVLGILAGSWLVARLLVVRDWIRTYNQRLMRGGTPADSPAGDGLAFDGGRAISSAAAALAVSIFILMIGSLMRTFPPFNPLQTLAELIPPAFWLALVFLRQPASSRSTFGKVIIAVVVLDLMLVITSLALNALLIPGFVVSYLSGFSKHTLVVLGISAFALPVLVAGVAGYCIALFYASWQEVRRRSIRMPAQELSLRPYDLLPLLGIIAFLPLAVVGNIEVYDLQVFVLQEPNLNLFLTMYVLVPLSGCIWIVGMAALITGRRLQS